MVLSILFRPPQDTHAACEMPVFMWSQGHHTDIRGALPRKVAPGGPVPVCSLLRPQPETRAPT